MAQMPPLHLARLIGLLSVSLSLSGCLFPVIDFDDLSAPHTLSVRARGDGRYARTSPNLGTQEMQPRVAGTGLTAVPPRQHPTRRHQALPEVKRLPRRSVMEPDIPAPELPMPASAEACHRALRDEGIAFVALAPADTPGVRWPIRLRGPVAGVVFEPNDHDATHAVLDCRLALALHAWAGELRRAGVRRVDYYSIYRPGARIAGSGRVSGHAHGMAIDAARFTLHSGAVLNILDDWEGRVRGAEPCPLRSDESSGGRLLRAVTCSAADHKLFQVVLTPHYNKAHHNHVHLEIKPEVDWTFVR